MSANPNQHIATLNEQLKRLVNIIERLEDQRSKDDTVKESIRELEYRHTQLIHKIVHAKRNANG